MPYVTIFDALQRPQTWLYVIPIGFLIIALLLWRVRSTWKRTPPPHDSEFVRGLLPVMVAILFTMITMIGSASDAADYYSALRALRDHRYHIVEGQVSQFSPIPEGGHGSGHFWINGTEFFYRDSRLDSFLKQSYPEMDDFQHRTWARVSYYIDRFEDKKIIKVEVHPTRVQSQ